MELILLLQAAFDRYEDFQVGRGELFMRHLDAALGLLRRQPEIGPVYRVPYRRKLIRIFLAAFSIRFSQRALSLSL